MPSNIEYALMAGRAYYDTRADVNRLPTPAGWTEFFHVPNVTYPTSSGFEAISFQRGNEIVISFAGTTTGVDWLANSGLATGVGSDQLRQAAAYFMAIRKANPGAAISFTGHSLGGGLAALMGVLFGETAVTFDQAPFRLSATKSIRDDLVTYLHGQGYSDADLHQWADGLLEFTGLSGREGYVTGSYVQGEALHVIPPASLLSTIGKQTQIAQGSPDLLKAVDLHSQTLLTAFVENDGFRKSTFKLTDLVGMAFDSRLYYNDPNIVGDSAKRNFLEHLVRHQNGVRDPVSGAVSIAQDWMLDRFTKDLWLIAQDGGLTMSNMKLADGLSAFAMQKYYDETSYSAGYGKVLYTAVAGGLHFNLSDVAGSLDVAKGYTLYLKDFFATLPGAESTVVTATLSGLNDWYFQAGANAMSATAGSQAAFMLGYNGADSLTGSAQADVLLGEGGNDTLAGGKGDDTMMGGAGVDTYVINSGDGNDTLIDSGQNRILFNGKEVAGAFTKNANGSYTALDGSGETITFGAGGAVLQLDANTRLTFANDTTAATLNAEGDGLRLMDAPAAAVPGLTVTGDLAPLNTPARYDAYGNVIVNPGLASPNRADVLNGSNGNDHLSGVGGNDILNGYDGNDLLEGGTGADMLHGGAGNDLVYADVQAALDPNAVSANYGPEILLGGSGNDLVVGAGGDDTIFGGDGADILVGGSGNDNMLGDMESSEVSPGWTTSRSVVGGNYQLNFSFPISEGTGDDVMYGGAGSDWMRGGAGSDLVDGGADDDVLFGEAGNDIVLGGSGNDWISGDGGTVQGDDWLSGGDGNDTIFGVSGNDALYGDAGADYLDGGAGSDSLDGGDGNDRLLAGDSDDTLVGGSGDDQLSGEAGNDQLLGGAGTDYLWGGDGDDILDGGAGNDQLDGGAGNDTYVVTAGETLVAGFADTITDISGTDTVILSGWDAAALRAQVDGNYLGLAAGANNNLWVLDGVVGSVERFQVGGETLSYAQLVGRYSSTAMQGSDAQSHAYRIGGSAGDSLTSASGNATVSGGAGNDRLAVQGNNNTILYGLGDGTDHVTTGGNGNVLRLGAGIAAADLKLSLGSLALQIGSDTNDVIHFDSFNPADVFGQKPFDSVQFDDGTTLSYAALLAKGFDIDGTDGADTLIGSNINDRISGGAGDDVLNAGSGNDTLDGGAGNDRLTGGAGNDRLTGGAGSDTYLWGTGSGQDIIDNTDATVGKTDTLVIGSTTDPITVNRVTLVQNGNDLTVHLSDTTDQIKILNQYASAAIDAIAFSDGTYWDAAGIASHTITNAVYMSFRGTSGNDVLGGTTGADPLAGGLGDDIYVVDNVGDVVTESSNEGNDTVQTSLSYALTQNVENLELIGTTAISGIGNNLNNTITGNSANNLLDGQGGADRMIGGSGNDTYWVDNSGDIVEELANGGSFDTVKASVSYTIRDNVEVLVLTGNAAINGTTTNALGTYLYGNTAANTLTSSTGKDVLDGGTGDDILDGGGGGDLLIGGLGADTYYAHNGDTIIDADGLGRVRLDGEILGSIAYSTAVSNSGAQGYFCVNSALDNHDLIIRNAAGTSSVTIKGFWNYCSTPNGANLGISVSGYNDPVVLDLNHDGIINALGSAESQAYFDFNGDGIGERTGWMAPVDGFLVQDGNGNGVIDGLGEMFGSNHSDGFSDLRARLDSNNDGFVDASDSGFGTLRVWRDANGDGYSQAGELATLAQYGITRINLGFSPVQLAATDNVITGTSSYTQNGVNYMAADINFALDFTRTNAVRTTGDSLRITGTTGNDVLVGSSRNETLDAGAGNDDYLFGYYSGHDLIVNNDTAVGKRDVIRFGGDVSPSDVHFIRSNDDLTISIGNPNAGPPTAGQALPTNILVKGYFINDDVGATSIQAIEFDDGTCWTFADVQARLPGPTTGNDVLIGYNTDDIIDALAGDDIIEGRAGNDTLSGGSGSDTLIGGAGDDTYRYNLGGGRDAITEASGSDRIVFGSGITAANLTSSRDGSDVLLATSAVDSIRFAETGPGAFAVERIEFADGLVWQAADLTRILNSTPTGNLTITGRLAQGQALTVVQTLADADGLGSVVYQWQASTDGSTWNDVSGATTASLALTEALVGKQMRVVASYTDGHGTVESGASTATAAVANVNDAPTGNVTVSGASVQNQVLTGNNTLADPDGLGTIGYQWQVSTDGTTWNAVSGATTASLTLTEAQVGKQVRMVASYTDGHGTVESLASTSTTKICSSNTIVGTSGADNLSGTNSADTLRGLGGDDVLNGNGGDDLLDGGDGNDVLDGGADFDTLLGGAGDDVLGSGSSADVWSGTWDGSAYKGNRYVGGTGNDLLRGTYYGDTYEFGVGDGQDVIVETSSNASYTDTLKFGAGISAADVSVVRNGTDLVFVLSGGTDKMTVQNWYRSDNDTSTDLERIEFSDGTVWSGATVSAQGLLLTGTAGNDTLNGADVANDTLRGLGGNDVLNGNGGDDVLDGGDGNDVLDGGAGFDTLLGGAGDDVLGLGSSADVWSGTWDGSAYKGNRYVGGTGNDLLRGTYYGDTYEFGVGDGQDMIVESYGYAGYADTLKFGAGISAADVSVVRNGTDLVFALSGGTDKVTVQNWYRSNNDTTGQLERIEFSDGTVWSGATVSAQGLLLTGTAGNDVLNGADVANDTLRGLGGNDVLNGNGGDDVLDGGDGNDVLDGGAGFDTLLGGAGDDVLGLGSSADVWSCTWDGSAYKGNRYVGGTGNDLLRGTYYGDTYEFGVGDGQEMIVESYGYAGYADTLKFGAGISAADVSVVRNGTDLVFALSGGTDKVTVQNWYRSNNDTSGQLERIEFSDGTVWSGATVSAQGLLLTGTAGNDVLNGADVANDTLRGLGGNDVLNSNGGDDVLDGGDGNDVLDGGAGFDTLLGGAGDDVLGSGSSADVWSGTWDGSAYKGNRYVGGTGNDLLRGTYYGDTYEFGVGDGQDVIVETSSNASYTDTLKCGAGITSDQIWLRHTGNSLEVSVIGTSDKVTISNWYSDSAYHLEQLKTADGKTLLDSQVDSLVQAMASFAPPAAGQMTLPPAYQTALAPVLAANWK